MPEVEIEVIEAEFWYSRKKTEAILRYPRKLPEAEFWLMLYPEWTDLVLYYNFK